MRYSNNTKELLKSPKPKRVWRTFNGAILKDPVFKLIMMTLTLIRINISATV
jgi:hypothetical protein